MFFTHDSGTIHLAAVLSFNKEIGQRQDKRQAIATHHVFPHEPSQSFRIVFVEEGQVDIARHGKGPQGIGGHEPTYKLGLEKKGKLAIWITRMSSITTES